MTGTFYRNNKIKKAVCWLLAAGLWAGTALPAAAAEDYPAGTESIEEAVYEDPADQLTDPVPEQPDAAPDIESAAQEETLSVSAESGTVSGGTEGEDLPVTVSGTGDEIPEETETEEESASGEEVADSIRLIIQAAGELTEADSDSLSALCETVDETWEYVDQLTEEEKIILSESINSLENASVAIEQYSDALEQLEAGGEIYVEQTGLENSWRYINGQSIDQALQIVDAEKEQLPEDTEKDREKDKETDGLASGTEEKAADGYIDLTESDLVPETVQDPQASEVPQEEQDAAQPENTPQDLPEAEWQEAADPEYSEGDSLPEETEEYAEPDPAGAEPDALYETEPAEMPELPGQPEAADAGSAPVSLSFPDRTAGHRSAEASLALKVSTPGEGDLVYLTVGAEAHLGIDVSVHQGTINWEQVKNSGIEFAIIRCGYGSDSFSQDDRQWARNASECERLGIPYGVYLYSYATTDEMLNSEVQHTLRLLQGRSPSLPIYIDIEDNSQIALGNAGVLNRFASSFCAQLQNAGYASGLYSSLYWYNSYFTSFAADGNFYHWVAQWYDRCTYTGRYEMWQYGSDGSVSGISTLVDMNIWYGSLDIGGHHPVEPPRITAQPSDIAGFIGETKRITVEAEGTGLTYQWQYCAPGSSTWTNSAIDGYDTNSFLIPLIAQRNGLSYRCVVTDSYGNTAVSEAASLTVYPNISSQPADVTAPLSETVRFSVGAKGKGLTYQWQYYASGSWVNSNLDGNKTTTLKVQVIEARNGIRYRCAVTDVYGNTIWSRGAVLKAAISVIRQPSDVKGNIGDMAELSVEATGIGLTYQWQFRAPGSAEWKDSGLPGHETAVMKAEMIPQRSNILYRCLLRDRNGQTLATDEVSLFIRPFIVSHPEGITAPLGDTAVFSAEADGDGLSYQWQFRSSPDGSWADSGIAGSRTASLQVPVIAARNGLVYRCRVTDANGRSADSAGAVLRVQTVIHQQPQNTVKEVGETAYFQTKISGVGLKYQWQYRTSASGSWKASGLAGSGSNRLQVPVIKGRNGWRYRCMVTDANGSRVYTQEAVLQVK